MELKLVLRLREITAERVLKAQNIEGSKIISVATPKPNADNYSKSR
ncbi:MAG: hypothetical protein IJA35_04070 [Clostridia bacterium]|nr:hypothetical protein [Clostridia bacterium]